MNFILFKEEGELMQIYTKESYDVKQRMTKTLSEAESTERKKRKRNFKYGLHKKLWDLREKYGVKNVKVGVLDVTYNLDNDDYPMQRLEHSIVILVNNKIYETLASHSEDFFAEVMHKNYAYNEKLGIWILSELKDFLDVAIEEVDYFKGCELQCTISSF